MGILWSAHMIRLVHCLDRIERRLTALLVDIVKSGCSPALFRCPQVALGYLDVARALINAGANMLLRDGSQTATMVGVAAYGLSQREFAVRSVCVHTTCDACMYVCMYVCVRMYI